MSGDSMAVQ